MKTIYLVLLDGKPHRAFETMDEAWHYSEANPLARFGCATIPLMEAGWEDKLVNREGWNKPRLVAVSA